MTRLFEPLRKTLLSISPKTLTNPQFHRHHFNPITLLSLHDKINHGVTSTATTTTRSYISDMRKSAFQDKILRLLRNETHFELDRSPPIQPVKKFEAFTIDERPGEQWIILRSKFGENEDIKVEATMFDGAITIPKSGGGDNKEEDIRLHLTLIVNISKGDGETLEIVCSAWPDTIEVTKLFIRKNNKMPSNPYVGPEFKELDDELQDCIYEFLEARGISDELTAFLHEYMHNKGRTEFIRWISTVYSYIEKK